MTAAASTAHDARRRTTTRRSGSARRRSRWPSSSASTTSPRPPRQHRLVQDQPRGQSTGPGADRARRRRRHGRRTLRSTSAGAWATSPPFAGHAASSARPCWLWRRGRAGGRATTGRRASRVGSAASWSSPSTSSGTGTRRLARADAFLAEVEAGSPHYLAAAVLHPPGADPARLAATAEGCVARRRARTRARAAGEGSAGPVSRPAPERHTSTRSSVSATAPARPQRSSSPRSRSEEIGFADRLVHVLAWTLTAAGRGEELASALERYAPNARGHGSALAFAPRRPGRCRR